MKGIGARRPAIFPNCPAEFLNRSSSLFLFLFSFDATVQHASLLRLGASRVPETCSSAPVSCICDIVDNLGLVLQYFSRLTN